MIDRLCRHSLEEPTVCGRQNGTVALRIEPPDLDIRVQAQATAAEIPVLQDEPRRRVKGRSGRGNLDRRSIRRHNPKSELYRAGKRPLRDLKPMRTERKAATSRGNPTGGRRRQRSRSCADHRPHRSLGIVCPSRSAPGKREHETEPQHRKHPRRRAHGYPLGCRERVRGVNSSAPSPRGTCSISRPPGMAQSLART